MVPDCEKAAKPMAGCNSGFDVAARRNAKRSGFTLLEVILALAILGGAIAVLGEASRLALRSAAAARDLARAQMLAENKMAEIEAGITAPDSVDNEAFDTESESLEQGTPRWLFSISSESTDETGIISVRVTVTRDIPAAQRPVKFSLVHFLPDPNFTYTPPPSVTSSSTGSTSGGSSSGSSSGSGGS